MHTKEPNARPVLKEILDLSLILAGYLYFVGWVYLYAYLSYFGLSIRQMIIEIYAIIIYSLNVLLYLVNHWYLSLPAFLIFFLLVHLFKQLFKSWERYITYTALGIAVIVTLVISRRIGHNDALRETNPQTTTLKTVEIIFKKDFMEPLSPGKGSGLDSSYNNYAKGEKNAFLRNMQNMKMRLLMESNGAYFLLHLDKAGQVPLVYILRKEDIQLLDTH